MIDSRRALSWVLAVSAAAAQDNLLLVVIDDVGVDKVGVYGMHPSPPPTPNLDALASRGVLFRNAWANPLCSPTRACIMTGRYSMRTGIGYAVPHNFAPGLRLGEITIPEVLDRAGSGYVHAAIGKWHLADAANGGDRSPNLAGWSHFAGLIRGAVPDYFAWPRTVDGATATCTEYATTRMVDDALAWIGRQTGPWLCYLAFNAAHDPWQAPPPHLHGQNLAGLDPAVEPIPFYTATVEAMDRELGRLLASLGPALARTNVVVLADNGTPGAVTQLPFDRSRAKGTPYERGVNVPLIVAGPAVQQPGREVTHLVAAVDVFATALELCGLDPAAWLPAWLPIDAVSFTAYLTDPAAAPRRSTTFAEQFGGWSYTHVNFNGNATLRDDRFKLIRRHRWFEPPIHQLFDLQADPQENNDLLLGTLGPAEAAAYAALKAELDRLRYPAGRVVPVGGGGGCAGSGGVPVIGADGVPRIGGRHAVTLAAAAAAAPALLLIGTSAAEWAGVPLPLDLAPLGAPGCVLSASGEVMLPRVTGAAGAASAVVALPLDGELVGRIWFYGWAVLEPANALGLVTTSALAAVVGT